MRSLLQTYYANDDLFDLSASHFVLDARAAWVTDINMLTDHLVQLKTSICERLPRCTMLMNRTLFHLHNWRKDLQTRQDHQATSNPVQPSQRYIIVPKSLIHYYEWCVFFSIRPFFGFV